MVSSSISTTVIFALKYFICMEVNLAHGVQQRSTLKISLFGYYLLNMHSFPC